MRVLLIGNGYLEAKHDLSKFDAVCVFDEILHREYFDKATHHFMRSDRPDHWVGMGLVGLDGYKAKPVLFDGSDSGFFEYVQDNHGAIMSGKLGNFSSMMAAMLYFSAYDIEIDGFDLDTFGGLSWEYETNYLKSICDGKRVICHSSGIVEPSRRKAHFVWIDGDRDGIEKDLSFGQFMSVYSFLIHHREWVVTLWTNADFKGDLVQRCKDKGLIVAKYNSILEYKFHPTTHKGATYSDYLRYAVLKDQGGLYCDIADTVTIANFDDIYDKCNRLGYSKVIGDAGNMSSGWLCVNRPDDPSVCKVVDWFDNHFEDGWGKHQMALSSGDLPEPLDSRIMFPYSFDQMRKHKKHLEQLPPLPSECRQVHFYNASGFQHHPWSFSEEYATISMENIKSHPSPISHLFRFSIEKAGDDLMKVDHSKVFGKIYESGWNNGKGSGAGSLPENCAEYIEWLPFFLRGIGCYNVMDWGCGDWQFSRLIDWTSINYVGVDCVKSVIESNRAKFSDRKNISFVTDKELKGDEKADVIVLKEVPIHWSNKEIVDFFNKAKEKALYALVCNSIGFDTNKDIETGSFRSFDPSTEPFNFPCREVFSWKPRNQAAFGTNKPVIMKCWLVELSKMNEDSEPKKRNAHFFWFEPSDHNRRDLLKAHWFSITSWIKHHPHWSTILWTNCDLSGAITDECRQMGLDIRFLSIDIVPKNQCNISSSVDWLKAWAIHRHGGMILDISDTVTLGNFDAVYDRSNRLSYSRYIDKTTTVVGFGWLCCNKPGNHALKVIMDEAPKNGSKFGWYEYRISEMATAKHPSIQPDMVASRVVFGQYAGESLNMWKPGYNLYIPPECLQFHLYRGNVIPSAHERGDKLEEFCNIKEWRTYNSVPCQLYRESMKGVKE